VSKTSESSDVKTIKKLIIRTIDKVDFHCCQECGGAWFQDRSVDEALSAAREDSWTMATPVPSAKTSAAELACPCCQGRLVAINDSQGSGAKVQRCLVCYGGWIQHSELIKSRNSSRDVLSQVGRFVRRLFK
jgi:Zn-finger nucleic acid-binding protein